MRQVLLRATHLLRRPPCAFVILVMTLGGSLLTLLPLFEVPGFELSLALTLVIGLIGGWVGIAAGLRVRGEKSALRGALADSSGLLLLALAVPFAFATGRTLLSTRCAPFAHVGFFALLPVPSVFLAASL